MTNPRSDRVDQLLARHRPGPAAGVDSLLPAPFYDQHISAVIGLAGARWDDYDQRMQPLAEQAYRWGFADLKRHTGESPSPAVAVYYGGIRLGAHLATHAVAAYTREHEETTGDDTLQEIIAAFLRATSTPNTSREGLLKLGMRLHRHVTACRYTLPILRDLVHVGTGNSTRERNAARAKLTRSAFDLIRTYGADHVRDAIQNAPLPAAATVD